MIKSHFDNIITYLEHRITNAKAEGLNSCGDKRRRTERTLGEGIDVGLCGHVHQHWRVSSRRRWINVGVDVWDFKPVILNELILLNKTRLESEATKIIEEKHHKKHLT